MAVILVVDDEAGIRSTVRDILQDDGHRVLLAEDGLVGLGLVESEKPELVILDVWLPRMGGLEALEQMRRLLPNLAVLVISGHGNIDMAVRALRLGAFDFLEKPLSIDRLLTSVRNALEIGKLREENKKLRCAVSRADKLVGSSRAMDELRALAMQAAASDARILITGENGTGKEMLARSIHAASPRAEGPFIALNCAAIPDTLLESELFGHEKGAFTDAVSRREGRFEAADGGTLFLDEVADLSLPAQAKVLRVLQEMRFERLGGERTIAVDVRVIAATNKDIAAEVAAGRFREDLFFRLAVVPLRMPALRERKEDIAELCAHFLARAAGDRAAKTISQDGMRLIQGRNWPGNVRELGNFIERLAVISDEAEFSAQAVNRALGAAGKIKPESLVAPRYAALPLAQAKELFERDYLAQKLGECDYNVAKAALAAGIHPSGYHAKIKKLGIEPKR